MEKLSKKTKSKLHIKNLDNPTWEKLCSLLDEDVVIGDNYRQLAGHVGLTRSDLAKISKASQPTDSVLKWWGHKLRATIPELMRILMEMGREDCVEILADNPIWATSGVSGPLQEYARISEELREAEKKREEAEKKREALHGVGYSAIITVGYSVWRFQDLKESTYQKLLTELAVEFNPPQKKFINFAEDLGCTRGDVNKFLISQNPVSSLLEHYEVNGKNNVFKLMEPLERIGRRDLVEMLWKEAKEFFEHKSKDQEREKRKADSYGEAEESVKRKKKKSPKKKVKKITA